MEIKTKFGIGDKVWYMLDNRPVCNAVDMIMIKVDGTVYRRDTDLPECSCEYLVGVRRSNGATLTEEMMFPDAESLKQSLFKEL